MYMFSLIFCTFTFEMKNLSTYLLIALAGLLIVSCYKVEEYPPEPEVSYKSFLLEDTTDILDNVILSGTLRLHFVDGDGDIGHEEPTDTASEEAVKNLFLDLLEKVDGVYQEAELAIPYEYRIPYFETTANDPTLRGDILVSDIDFYPPFEGDTVKLRFYLIDRAGNKSNVGITPEIVLADSLNLAE